MKDMGLKFAGTVYARLKGQEAWFELGNTTSLTIKAQSEKDERISFKKGSFGQALDALYTPKPPEISWENDTFNRRNFAFMLLGQDADLSAEAKVQTDVLVSLKKGVWVDLPDDNLNPTSFSLKTKADKVIPATDYVVNYNLGMVQLLEEAKTEAGEGKASYQTRTGGGFVIDAAQLNSLNMQIRVDGVNRLNLEEGILNVWECSVTPEGDFDWLKGDWGAAKFSGTCLTPSDKPSPYQFKSFAL